MQIHTQLPHPATAAVQTPQHTLAAEGPQQGSDTAWGSLIGRIGADIAEPLTAALERVEALAASGRIDRGNLRALCDEVTHARRAAMVSQQLARLTSNRHRHVDEKLDLEAALAPMLEARRDALLRRGIALRCRMEAARVWCDPSLLHSMLDTLLDWTAAHAVGTIDIAIGHQSWPEHVTLAVRFTHQPADRFADPALPTTAVALDTLDWLLIQRSAAALAARLERNDTVSECSIRLVFIRQAERAYRPTAAFDLDQGFSPASGHKPLAGYHILVVGRRDLRTQVRDAIRGLDLIADFVGTVDEAAAFCAGGLPHALICDPLLDGERLQRLRSQLQAEAPGLLFVNVVDDSTPLAPTGPGRATIRRTELPTLLSSTLARLLVGVR